MVPKLLSEDQRARRVDVHHGNAPAHNALSIRQFLAERQITTLEHPPYSPDLAPCDFWLFPKVKSVLKGSHFEGVEDIQEHVTSPLRTIKKEEFLGCFEAWKNIIQKCINFEGEYFEGENK